MGFVTLALALLSCAGLAAGLQPSSILLRPGEPDVFGPHPLVPPGAVPSRANRPLHNQGLVQVAYSDPATGVYLGSPSIARLNPDILLISHDFFPQYGKEKATEVLSSKAGGASWQPLALVPRIFWATLFVHRGAVYLLGTDDDAGANGVSMARSLDGGITWNQSVVLRPPPGCSFATGTVPVLLQGGFLYRSMEYWCGPTCSWPQGYIATLISAPAGGDADLLAPGAWRMARGVQFDGPSMLPAWMPAPVVSGGYLEGSAVRLPGGTGVGLLLRCRVYDAQSRTYTLQHACFFTLGPSPVLSDAPATRGAAGGGNSTVWHQGSGDGGMLRWQGFVDLPGGGNKFVCRWDPFTRRYLALTNPSIDRYGANPDARNILVLAHSPNLRDWRVATTLLVPHDGMPWEESLWKTGYQYADWIVDGDDIVASIRTAYDGANSFHDSNMITFKRIERYRKYLVDPVVEEEAAATA
ncbi:glycosyl hydrolase [Micractinium conductrix]|uniref:Glycosyl hydrolase n=1 Tax=Micractinium conductrix TaxID=554055 RepID=A0A2P6V369_9CHLO|nr:glycosyl hydrolase [Micractinium conductrix]|eukprot:PSC68514.1 glycosyl hydrolase [Micractinium conductrix]